jgi:hypothetical protein
VRNPIGTNQHVGVDNVHRLKRRDGNSRDHALANCATIARICTIL